MEEPILKKRRNFYSFGPFRLYVGERELFRGAERVTLPPKTCDTLLLLLRRHGHVVDKEELMRTLWPDTFVGEDSLAQQVSHLRKTLGQRSDGGPYIETVARRGYRFAAPVAESWEAELGTAGAPRGGWPRQPEAERAHWRTWAIVGFLLAGLAGGALWWYLRPKPPPPRLVPLTSLPGHESQPAISADGNQVAFVWTGEGGGNADVYVKVVGAASELRLTTDPASDHHPAWSPAGDRIAFLRDSPGGASVFLISPLGGEERKLCQLPGPAAGLSWSPDGKLLAFSGSTSPQERSAIYLLPIQTGEPRQITFPSAEFAGDSDPVFSPDGRALAFARPYVTTQGEIFVLPLGPDGSPRGEARRVLLAGQFLSGLAWTPEGSAIIFSSLREGSQTLWKVKVSGSGPPERVSIAGNRAYQPSLARRVRRLVYRDFVEDTNIWRMPGLSSGQGGGKLPGAPVRLIASTWLDDSPQYSPDGQQIVLASNRSGTYEIWVCRHDGSGCHPLTSVGGPHVGSPRWSPDGRWIVFDRADQGRRHLEVISAEGGVPKRLTSEPFNHVRPSYSRDGGWIYFGCDCTGRWEIWKMPAAGGAAVRVTREGGGREAFESVDGKYLYYDKEGTYTLWRVPVNGGKEELVVPRPIWHGHWAVLAEGLLILNPEAKPAPALELFRFATGRRSTLAPLNLGLDPGRRGFTTPALAVSPDERWILYVQMDRNSSDLMLVEDLPDG